MLKKLGFVGIIALALTMAMFASTRHTVAAQSTSAVLSIPDATLTAGGLVSLDLTADSLPNGLAGFSIGFATVDPSVAKVTVVSGPDYGLSTQSTEEDTSLRFNAVDLNRIAEAGATDFVLATIAFEGIGEGSTGFTVLVDALDDDGGFPITPMLDMGEIVVTNSLDLDGDGITEDINANGFFDFGDIVALFLMLVATWGAPVAEAP